VERTGWALLGVLASALCQSMYSSTAGWVPAALATAMGVAALLTPAAAILILAGLGPIAGIIFVLSRTEAVGLRFDEAIVLAFIAGWSFRRALSPVQHHAGPTFRWAITLLLAAALASACIALVDVAATNPSMSFWRFLSDIVLRDYLASATPLLAPMLFVEGLVLSLIAADWCAPDRHRRDAVLRMMVAGAAAAATFNLLRLVLVAASRENAWSELVTLLATQRVNVHYGDLNAAGSYFAMMLFIAGGFAARYRLAIVSTAIIAAGLWISGSRTALAAALLTAAAASAVHLWRRTGRRLWPVLVVPVLLVVVTTTAAKWYPAGRNVEWRYALQFRVDAADAAVKLTKEHPWFGVGLGRFYPLSEQYLGLRENAHNNFLQIMAELGMPALALFLLANGAALRGASRSIAPRGPSWGLQAGLAVFLLTCLAGHPLLVAGAAFPFWLALGLAAASAGPDGQLRRGVRLGAIAVLLAFAMTLPFRAVEATRTADVEHVTVGMSSLWQREPDGTRYRWAGGRSAFFVPSGARVVRIPLRHGGGQPDILQVRIFIDGREGDRIFLRSGEEWRTLSLLLPSRSRRPFFRIDLEATSPDSERPLDVEVTESGGLLAVGRPEIVIQGGL
jgi:O-antigen ligase